MKHKRKNRFFRFVLYFLLVFVVVIAGFLTWYYFDTQISKPNVNESIVNKLHRETLGVDQYRVGNNWLKKNDYGLWEMYLEGAPFERGVASGKLTKELIYKQEVAFVNQIKELIPSESYLDFLKYFVKFFNRDIDEFVIPEFQEEIYGISFSASNDFNFIGNNYERLLNYHAAHDIGHALQDLMLVGCTSFAANFGFNDSSLIIGRNFDFYINDAFAEDKIICFENPDNGYQFAYVTWASMIGVVSGMNNQGLTVTINAGKSDIPLRAATPISLLAREILQYASNIDEAIEIAEKRKTFVAESLLIGSANDNKAIIIEKSPSKMGIYKSNEEYLVCSNHFQSDAFSNDKANRKQILESTSTNRQNRAIELITETDSLNYLDAALVLRDRKGLKSLDIGIGNEKAMAQMISHHSIIFQPMKRNMWVSTSPYQLGKYLNYNLTHFFESKYIYPFRGAVHDSAYTIEADPFLFSAEFQNFQQYKEERKKIIEATELKLKLDIDYIRSFIELNPEYYQSYVLIGDYYIALSDHEKALKFYNYSLTKEFEKNSQLNEVQKRITELNGN